jgi:dienelactone hydrolase
MWRFIARPLDRCAIRSACGSVLPSPDGQPHADEAAAFLKREDFFAPQVAPAALKFTGKNSFEFPSPVRSDSAANDLVRGHCEFAAGDWEQRPSVIMLHGWNASLQYQWQFPYWSQLLARAGVNAFRFELPHHMSRTPIEPGVIRNFLSGNLLHVMRTTHQALADIRALALWLRAQGSPAIGLWGISLGAWLSGLAAAHQSEIDAATLIVPVVRMDRALKELAFFEPIRASLIGLERPFESLNLVAHAAPRAKTLIAASQLDLFAPTETIDELERAWHCETWRLNHGHLSLLLSSRVIRRLVRWMAASLDSVPAASGARV